MEDNKQEEQPKIKPLTKKDKQEIKRCYLVIGKWLNDHSLKLEKPCYMLIKKDETGAYHCLGISTSANGLAIMETAKKNDVDYIG